MGMTKYIDFNIESFVSDYFRKKGMLKYKIKELSEVENSTPCITSDRVLSSNVSDSTYATAVRRLNLRDVIDGYKSHIDLYENAVKNLTEEEREVLFIAYGHPLKETPLVSKIESAGYKKTTFYERKESALNKLFKLIVL